MTTPVETIQRGEKEYTITIAVTKCTGWRDCVVKAHSKQDALAKFKNGEGVFVDECIQVTDWNDPGVSDVREN